MEYGFGTFKDLEIWAASTPAEKFAIGYTELYRRIEEKMSSSYIGKAYKALLNLIEEGAEWMKEYIFRPFERLIKNRIQRNTRQNRAEANKRDAACPTYKNALDRIIYTDDTVRQNEGVNQFYICRMIKDNGKVVYQKIGTTHRDTNKRMYEHLRDHWDKGVRKIVVDRVYDVKDMPDITIESHFRAKYGRKYKEYLVPTDRFKEAVIDLDDADKEFVNFMMGN